MSNRQEPSAGGWEIIEHEPEAKPSGKRKIAGTGGLHGDAMTAASAGGSATDKDLTATVESSPAKGSAGEVSDDVADAADDSAAQAERISAFAVALLGVFGGVYLLYSWGWFVVATAYAQLNALTAMPSGVIGVTLQTVLHWLAPAAPGAWFILVMLLCKKTDTLKMTLGLLLGALILMPLPLFIATAY